MQHPISKDELISRGKKILYDNRLNGYTLPTKKLYPFQWNWDSGFVSIGFSRFDVNAAFTELNCLVKGQWDNGMIPHIVFHSENETTYFPNWDFWDVTVNKGAPKTTKTSGITQPPVLGFALEWLWNNHPNDKSVQDRIKTLYPKIVKSHSFWYNYRDPNDEGLVFIFHPWESGRDNSPLWDEPMNRIDLENADIPQYKRRDINIADASERPTSKQYDQYVYLMLLGKKHRYDGPGIVEESEFLIQDTLVNAMLISSNASLIKLGKQLGEDTTQIEEWQKKSIQAYRSKLWNTDLGHFVCYDLKTEKQLPYREIGGLTSLFAEIADDYQAKIQHDYLKQLSDRNFLIAPSFDVDHAWYDSKRYWRGPIWPQMNWLIYHGLKKYNYDALADQVKVDFIELVNRFGFHEYFEAQRNLVKKQHGGYGGNHFSWTASTVIDFLSE